MQVLEEELLVKFSANEWGSVSTILQLLIFLFKAFATEQTFRKGRTTVMYAYSLMRLLRYLIDH